MPVTVLICAICEVICALSSGFIGSWLFICATSSLRKRSCSPVLLLALTLLVLLVAVLAAVLAVVELMAVLMAVRFLKEGGRAYWPICRVLSSSDLAVFMTSTLFWYEREAEIMLTISSTALTLEWLT